MSFAVVARRRLARLNNHLSPGTAASGGAGVRARPCSSSSGGGGGGKEVGGDKAASGGSAPDGGGAPASAVSARLKADRRQGHAVPAALQASRGSAAEFLAPDVPKPSLAEKARTLVAQSPSGVLSTLLHDSGHPYGSVINVASDPADGQLITFISRLAEHTANLSADARASFIVSSVQGAGDRLATARATLVGRCVPVDKTPALMEAFLKAHPGAHYVRFADFSSYKLLVSEKVRMISGFGEMGWVTPEAFAAAEPDLVSAGARGAVEHMNKDHAHDVLAMSRAFAGLPLAKQATLLAIDRYGLDVLCEMPDGSRRSRVAFPTRLDRPEQIKDAVISLTMSARAKLHSASEGEKSMR